MTFSARVRSVVARVPRGKVLGYRDVAALAGNALAARQVARAMKDANELPWWRIVASDGSIRVGPEQRRRLRAEGVTFRGARVKMEAHRWAGARGRASRT